VGDAHASFAGGGKLDQVVERARVEADRNRYEAQRQLGARWGDSEACTVQLGRAANSIFGGDEPVPIGATDGITTLKVPWVPVADGVQVPKRASRRRSILSRCAPGPPLAIQAENAPGTATDAPNRGLVWTCCSTTRYRHQAAQHDLRVEGGWGVGGWRAASGVLA
jgi:hypothetical protein